MTYAELFCLGKETLASAGVEEAELDARLLLEYVCGTDRNDLLAHGDRLTGEKEQTAYRKLIKERAARIPLQHLTGVQEFMGLEFAVNGQVLIPRQDTEILVEEALKYMHDGMRILDMCTGSGCILISLLHYTNNCQGVGADISEAALEVAKGNAEKLLPKEMTVGKCTSGALMENIVSQTGAATETGIRAESAVKAGTDIRADDGFGSISFLQSDLFEKICGKFDIIVSNPPYIRSTVIDTLMPEVREHEPVQALDGGDDGLFFYRRIVEEGKKHLCGGGMIFLEIGYDQADAVCSLMEQAGYLEVNVVKDYAGLDRVVYGTLGFL